MKLKYIGKDGSLGLNYGEIYQCDIESKDGFVWVRWRVFSQLIPPLFASCPYVSITKMLENWEEIV